MRLFSLLALASLLPIGGVAYPQSDARQLTPEEWDAVNKGVTILEAKAAEENLPKLRLVAQALRALLGPETTPDADKPKSRIVRGGLPANKVGRATGPDAELNEDGSPGPGAGKNQIQLNDDLFPPAPPAPPAPPETAEERSKRLRDYYCSAAFLKLIGVLAHEGTHIIQPAVADFPHHPAPFERMLQTNPKDLIKAKLALIENELQAYGQETNVIQQIQLALVTIDTNDAAMNPPGPNETPEETAFRAKRRKKGLHGWAEFLLACSSVEIKRMIEAKIGADRDLLLRDLNGLSDFPDTMRDRGRSDTQIAEDLDQKRAFEFVKGRYGVALEIHDRYDRIWGTNPDGCRWSQDAGIQIPQDAEVIQDRAGLLHVIVCGISAWDGGTGIVRIFPVPKQSHQFPPPVGTPGGTLDVPFSAATCKTIVCNNPFVQSPTSVLVSPDGHAWVWDVAQAALFPLVDDDDDGVPDRIELHSAVAVRHRPAVTDMSSLSWVGDQAILEVRAGGTFDFGDMFVYAFRDHDHDGFFESVRLTRSSRLLREALRR